MEIDIHKEKAHQLWVNSLCSLNGKRLLSGSVDYSMKVWTVSEWDLTLVKEIKRTL